MSGRHILITQFRVVEEKLPEVLARCAERALWFATIHSARKALNQMAITAQQYGWALGRVVGSIGFRTAEQAAVNQAVQGFVADMALNFPTATLRELADVMAENAIQVAAQD